MLNLVGVVLLPIFKLLGSVFSVIFNISSIFSVFYGIFMGIMISLDSFINPILDTISAFGSLIGMLGDDAMVFASEEFSGGMHKIQVVVILGVQTAEGGIVPAKSRWNIASR